MGRGVASHFPGRGVIGAEFFFYFPSRRDQGGVKKFIKGSYENKQHLREIMIYHFEEH